VATVEDGMPALVEAREVVGAFQAMVRAMEPGRLEGWLRRAEASLVASFARGIGRDSASRPWSTDRDRSSAIVPRFAPTARAEAARC
jgi:hypothetical protein